MAEIDQEVFDKILAGLQKALPTIHISTLSESTIANVTEWVKTPALDLNRIISGSLFSGIPHKNLVGIVGPEHTMKSSFMVLCMVEAQKQGYIPFILDSELGCGKNFAKRWGLNTELSQYFYVPYVDDVKITLAQIKKFLLETGQKGIIGLDSVGGLDQDKVMEDALKGDPKADQGQLQKKIRSMLKMMLNVIIETGSVGIVTGHMYSRPGQVPLPDQIGGGKAMRMFPSILLSLKKEKSVEGKSLIKATSIKNRMYPPFQDATIEIDYNKGIDIYAGIVDLLIEAGIVTQGGSWFTIVKTGEKLGQGFDKATANLVNHPELLEEVDEWLKNTGYSTHNDLVEQAEKLLENVDVKTADELDVALAENPVTIKKKAKK